jgi:micrococcal nuclease
MPFTLLSKSLKTITVVLLILSLFGCEAISKLFGETTHSVKKVSDGDTMKVIDANGTEIDVRFACVDAPEVPHSNKEKKSRKAVDKSQFKWGVQAQQRVQELVKQGGDRVQLTTTDTDQYGRSVSEVRLPDGTFIQQVLVQEGLAQVYRQYLKDCPSAEIVEAAEADAKKRRVGLWRDDKYVSAWEWRSLKK